MERHFIVGKKGQFYLILIVILTILISSYISLRPRPRPIPNNKFNLVCENFMEEASLRVNHCVYSNCSNKELVNDLSDFINSYSDYLKYDNLSVFVALFYDKDYLFETFPNKLEVISYELDDTPKEYFIDNHLNLSRDIAHLSLKISDQEYDFNDELLKRSYENFNYSDIILLKAVVYSARNGDIKICYYNTSLV